VDDRERARRSELAREVFRVIEGRAPEWTDPHSMNICGKVADFILERDAAVRAEEREACAKVAEETPPYFREWVVPSPVNERAAVTCSCPGNIAAAIRSLGDQ
jgi:hypothetical protein